MKKLLIFLSLGFISLNTYANNCGGEFQPETGTCRIIGPDGKQILYNSAPPQSRGNAAPPKKIIRHITVNVPSQYGALALDEKTSSLGSSNNHSSLAEAKKAAIRQCGEKGCKVITWVKNGCIAAAGGKVGSKWKLTKAAEERGEAEQIAMSRCRKSGISDCTIVVPETCSIPDISKY